MQGERGGLHGGPGGMFRGGFRGGSGMNQGDFGGGRRSAPGCPPGPLMEQMEGRRGRRGGPGKMDKGEHHQERGDWPYSRDLQSISVVLTNSSLPSKHSVNLDLGRKAKQGLSASFVGAGV